MNKHKLINKYSHDNIKQKQSQFIKLKSHFSSHFRSHQSAFTIVELLVVIVVIGILATIIFVSYSGVTKKATEAVIKSDLNNNSKLLELYQVENGSYPTALDANNCPTLPVPSTSYCLKVSNGNTLSYISSGQTFKVIATNTVPGISYTITETGTITETASTFAYTWGGSSTSDDTANSIVATADGGYIIAGDIYGFGAGSSDAFVAKYDSYGIPVWDKTWGGAGWDLGSFATATADGGYVLAGYTGSFGTAGSGDAYVAKFNSDGTLVWNKTWGGTGNDIAISIAETVDGSYVVTGYTNSFGAGASDNDVFLAKYANDGALVWNKTWGGTGQDYALSITATRGDNFVITGSTSSFGGGAFLTKFTSDGTMVWDKILVGISANSIATTNDDGLVVAGSRSNDTFIAKLTNDGELVWSKTWGGAGSDIANSIITTNDDSIVMTGETRSFGVSYVDAFVAKFTSNGTLVWDRTWGSASYDYAKSIATTANSGYVMVGYTDGFNNGDNDVFLAKFSADGVLDGCTATMCKDPNASESNPGATTQDLIATETNPDASKSNPTASSSDPTSIIVDVVGR